MTVEKLDKSKWSTLISHRKLKSKLHDDCYDDDDKIFGESLFIGRKHPVCQYYDFVFTKSFHFLSEAGVWLVNGQWSGWGCQKLWQHLIPQLFMKLAVVWLLVELMPYCLLTQMLCCAGFLQIRYTFSMNFTAKWCNNRARKIPFLLSWNFQSSLV